MTLTRFITHKHFWQAAALLAADMIFFDTTNATKVAPSLLIVAFILLVLTSYFFFYGLLSLLRFYGLVIRRKRRLAVYLTVVSGVVFALQSINELSSRDILVLLPLAVLGYLYGNYAAANSKNT